MTDKNEWSTIQADYHEDAVRMVKDRLDSLAKPVGGLGYLEQVLMRIAGLTGEENYDISKRAVAVFCADNGVVKQGVTQAGSEVTAILAGILTTGDATVNHMAKEVNADVFPVDMGMASTIDDPALLNGRIAAGTGDISQGPAMSNEQACKAINFGINLTKDLKDKGYKLVATGEVGIGNTTASSALAAVLLSLDPVITTGRGTGISDEVLAQKTQVVRQAIEINKPNPNDALDVLAKLGGFDIAGMVGAFIGGALYRIPVLIDGVTSAAAALVAARLCPAALGAMHATQVSAEPASGLLLEALDLKPLVAANLHLGEGGGAVAAIPLLDITYRVYRDMVTLEEIAIKSYKPTV